MKKLIILSLMFLSACQSAPKQEKHELNGSTCEVWRDDPLGEQRMAVTSPTKARWEEACHFGGILGGGCDWLETDYEASSKNIKFNSKSVFQSTVVIATVNGNRIVIPKAEGMLGKVGTKGDVVINMSTRSSEQINSTEFLGKKFEEKLNYHFNEKCTLVQAALGITALEQARIKGFGR